MVHRVQGSYKTHCLADIVNPDDVGSLAAAGRHHGQISGQPVVHIGLENLPDKPLP
jgi:hypothetical protein